MTSPPKPSGQIEDGEPVAGVRVRTGVFRRNALPLYLATTAFLLLALLYRTDREQELYNSPSARYRCHAIPVAIAQIYHGTPHNYTSYKHLALRFQAVNRDIQEVMFEAIHHPPVKDAPIYFWVADDRGLSDYVSAAFQLFGPHLKSLSKFYFLLLGSAVVLFLAGYWRSPGILVLPICILCGMLALAQLYKLRAEIPVGEIPWGEEIALYESRMFDLLALISCFHLVVLTIAPRAPRAAWITALPQAAMLIFLYHARSSLGWQYLGLFSIAGAAVFVWVWRRWRRIERPTVSGLARPVFVAGILTLSLIGLSQYKRTMYHPLYFAELGPRTFWHNALMGFTYHPQLRTSLPLPCISDKLVAELVLKRMQESNDSRLDANWNTTVMMNSLGSHVQFDWKTYEEVAREIYISVWREHTTEAAECYAYYKPRDVVQQASVLVVLLGRESGTTRARNLLPGLGLCLFALGLVFAVGRANPDLRQEVRTGLRVALALIPFSLIPGIAFYAAIPTLSCFYTSALAVTQIGLVWVGWILFDRFRAGRAGGLFQRMKVLRNRFWVRG